MSQVNDGDKPQDESNCVGCEHLDNIENMVACDSCGSWYHFSCAEVDEGVSNQPWKCTSCGTFNQTPMTLEDVEEERLKQKTLVVPSNGGKSSRASDFNKPNTRRSKKLATKDSVSVTSSVRSRALEIEMQMLEEQERIKEQELKEEKELKQKKLRLEKQLRDRELELEAKKLAEDKAFQEKQLADEEKFRKAQKEMRQQSLEKKKSLVRQLSQRGSEASSVCQSETAKSVEKVKKWLQKSGKQTEGDNKKKSTSAAKDSRKVSDKKPGKPIFDDVPHPVPDKARRKIKPNEKWDKTETSDDDSDRDIKSQQAEKGPTKHQLAARQVMGKDLPVFSGNPEEWPICISNFERSTATCGFSQDENLIRLQRCLKSSALEMVRSRLLSPNSVPHVIKTLQSRYGRPETLIKALTEKIRHLPPPRMDNLESIVDFGMAVDNLVEHLKNANQQPHLTNPSLLHDLVGKLPVDYRLKWSAFKSAVEEVNLGTFGLFMSSLMELAFEVMDDTPTGKSTKGVNSRPKDRGYVQAHSEYPSTGPTSSNNKSTTPTKQPIKICAYCKMDGHRVMDCFKFKSLNIDERFKVISQNSLCRTCLNQPGRWPCKTWRGCGIEGCRLRHHTLLHSATPSVPTVVSTSHSEQQTNGSPFFRILPVTLYGDKCKLNVYAFVDEGSQLTLLDDGVAEQLGITGPIETLNLQWTGNITRNEPNSRRIRVEISGCELAKRYKLFDARTVASLQLPTQSLHYHNLATSFPHLRSLPISDYENVTPKLLIGLDNLKLTVPLKIREGGWGQPMAAKCRLGWSIYGCSQTVSEPFTCGFHVGGWTNPEPDLNQLVRDYITLDNSGVAPPLTPLESEEDKRARMLLQSTTSRIGNRFETGLLWKWDDIQFPNSYGMAYRRLRSLEKRLSKEPHLYDCVRQQMREYQEKGYAHQATTDELSNTYPEKCWYLPIGVVLNPKKPDKVRIIWDAAAKVNGISLNSALRKGPDFLTSLIAVFFHFRLYAYALTGDIKEMFHRFFIRLADRQFLRFLWRDRATLEVVVFIMDVAIFGATCSPSSAQYIKNLNAREFEAEFPRAVAAIVHYHYVDDYLDSFSTAEEAVKVGSEVKRIHAEGGFEIRNFLSNDPAIAVQVGAESMEPEKSIKAEKGENVESVLGMKWIPSGDELTYTFVLREDLKHALDDSHTPTKREVLRVVMSLFDPLGLISFFLIHGRTLMQDIWASGADWDEPINNTLCGQWKRWTALLSELNLVRIPRCYFFGAGYETYSTLEIHVFVDASRSAYASVVYFRVDTTQGPAVALVAGKAKVAPLKMMSIPRLELQGAVLGSRLLNSVMAMHKLPVTRRVLWTDSEIVLAWLRSDNRKYQQFVGFRVAEILSTTDVQEWRKIESELNVADQATKWGGGPNFNVDNPWFRGPKFLSKPESFWPQQRTVPYSTEEEIRKMNVHTKIQSLIEATRFSRWEKLERTVSLVQRFVDNLKRKRQGKQLELGVLKQEELAKAEATLYKQAQQNWYAEEVAQLNGFDGTLQLQHSVISRTSNIYKLWPFLDQCGVMRMRGRIDAAPNVAYSAKHPTILPQKSRITFLLADKFHRRFRHANRETVINEMRQEYHIPKMRALVARVTKECVYCRIRNAIPRSPPMAQLPNVRVTPFVRPFTFVGLDYFGPILVKVGRSNVKRWVALFTCLSIRAVHMEVVHSMSTESCVLAVRRFVSRRGSPAEFFSDNGTNFIGANNQLKKEIQDREERLASVFTNANTRWSFNPPGAPHMGGVWERMVRSVKAAIKPDDETLETVIVEAEAMINTRPLTYIPLESADQESLTPNHFLLGSSSGVKQLAVQLTDYRMTLRSSWKLAQHLADEFWKRWLKEYLPVISRRSKWFEDVKDIQEGDLVFVVDGSTRNQWTRGRVERVAVGADGRIRQAWVRTSRGVVRRPVVKLAMLDVMENGDPRAGDYNGSRAGECDGEKPPNATAM
ncbi:uncharacterized protein LOC135703310 [Ochlerotatus camptorhynchus]|uniref:uncharacterized protein LOC135703310 n=1 Tax=Ochlerotatus camptorhynchus TaxID=644619 RepID=UPI0031D1395A